jgi:hypothetical protein
MVDRQHLADEPESAFHTSLESLIYHGIASRQDVKYDLRVGTGSVATGSGVRNSLCWVYTTKVDDWRVLVNNRTPVAYINVDKYLEEALDGLVVAGAVHDADPPGPERLHVLFVELLTP